MKEHPILMSALMVRALRAGEKSQTRRAVKPQPDFAVAGTIGERGVCARFTPDDERLGRLGESVRCPYGQPGDRLYVKEAVWMWCELQPNGTTPTDRKKWRYAPMREAGVFYAADHPAKPSLGLVSPNTGNQWGWRLKIGRFMPKWASRIDLEITAIRVERLQDISESDAKAEGAFGLLTKHCTGPDKALLDLPLFDDDCPYRNGYALLWESINGDGSWAANPWVWVVEFRRIES